MYSWTCPHCQLVSFCSQVNFVNILQCIHVAALTYAFKGRYCPTAANRGRKWYQSIDISKLSGRSFSCFHFKGTPSREEHKTVHSIFTTVESALTGLVGLLRSSVSPSSRHTVPWCPRTNTVWRATLLYIFICWLVPINGANHQYSTGTGLYSSCMATYHSCTVPKWHRTAVLQVYDDEICSGT